jgi:transcription initiation factor TFIID TATA-box-binding protein
MERGCVPEVNIKPEVNVKIQNVVATLDIFQHIDLEDITGKLPQQIDTRYEPKRFPGIILKFQAPQYPYRCSILLFSTGKAVIVGMSSTDMIHEVKKDIVEILHECGVEITRNPEAKIVNIVASGSLGRQIDLELTSVLLESCMYEPEQFPGLIYRMKVPKTVILLFKSGNIVCTGAKSDEMVEESVKKLEMELDELGAFIPD